MRDESARRAMVATRAANAGAEIALERFRTDHDVDTKAGKTDVVTQADRDAQAAVVAVIREAFPDDPIVGEEDDELKVVPETGPAWIVDPIDGTSNYVRGSRTFCTAVAAVIDGEPVASTTVFPALSDTYHAGPDGAFLNDEALAVSDRSDPETCIVCPTMWWDHGRRDEFTAATSAILERFADLHRSGCGQASLSRVAAGIYDGTITNLTPDPWDSVAGVRQIRDAGGTVTDLEGERWRHDSHGLVASNGRIHDLLLEAAREIEAVR
ncbi:inositol monophosphatase family protein [Natronobiforma cellulositropha]|uniref:inositol monophosphatase family protein n=1 Tax=Natronobiforma cellulositropha TaxID=1679076 RepID=UPI0021D5EA52|nr:inositol monophosphatase [Natronobiforma cellulositropha]